MRLLLMSNSTNAGEGFLDYSLEKIRTFLGPERVEALFIPYAGVTISFNDYEKRVRDRFADAGHDIKSIHHYDDPGAAVRQAAAIVIGGGNTFRLAELLHKNGLVETISNRVRDNLPYVGWSAGANVACPTICTTNDMPVVQPVSFNGFNLLKFQINPHYLDANPAGHAGETREMRINEYIEINRDVYVIGLREGCMLLLEGGRLELIGTRSMRVFKYGSAPVEIEPQVIADFLL
jgi:dipeptidase E